MYVHVLLFCNSCTTTLFGILQYHHKQDAIAVLLLPRSLIPKPCPAFRCLQYGISGDSLSREFHQSRENLIERGTLTTNMQHKAGSSSAWPLAAWWLTSAVLWQSLTVICESVVLAFTCNSASFQQGHQMAILKSQITAGVILIPCTIIHNTTYVVAVAFLVLEKCAKLSLFVPFFHSRMGEPG